MDFGNGTPKQILSAAAHTLLSLRGCRGGNGNQVQSLLSAMGRPAPGYLEHHPPLPEPHRRRRLGKKPDSAKVWPRACKAQCVYLLMKNLCEAPIMSSSHTKRFWGSTALLGYLT